MRFNNKNVILPSPLVYPGLTFTSIGNSTIAFTNNGGNAPDMKYSLDGGNTWILWNYSSISLSNGENICFKGNNYNGLNSSNTKYSSFIMSGTISASGNIMSLIDNGSGNTTVIPNDYCFLRLFLNCSSLINAPELPAIVLTTRCYQDLFNGCTGLTSYNILPATTLAEKCYAYMFSGCSNLTTAPILSATTLANSCYNEMFSNCTKLSSAPELPATTLVNGCYGYMFKGCTLLNKIISYAQDISASGCLSNWVTEVSSTGDFYNLGGATYPSGTSGIPSGWTVHTSL